MIKFSKLSGPLDQANRTTMLCNFLNCAGLLMDLLCSPHYAHLMCSTSWLKSLTLILFYDIKPGAEMVSHLLVDTNSSRIQDGVETDHSKDDDVASLLVDTDGPSESSSGANSIIVIPSPGNQQPAGLQLLYYPFYK